MRIDEINLIPDFGDDEYRGKRLIQNHAEGARSARNMGRLAIGLQVLNKGDDYYLVTSRGELVGRAQVLPFDDHYKVNHIWFRPEWRRKGVGYQFYAFFIDHVGSIISDYDQTLMAKRMWSKLAQNGYVREYDRTTGAGRIVTDTGPYYGEGIDPGRDKLLIAGPK